MFEPGKYKNFSNDEVEKDLEAQGYRPLLIVEKSNDSLEAHSHPQAHILVVVQGTMKVKLKDKEIIMTSGDKITLEPFVEHAAFFGEKGCEYFWVEF
ncbi:cupin domain-containing protein [Candidatus Microgenomates bacterium]|nr:cupin domain-containing protein [Candidatus Microgenomates bacterium]